MQADVLNFNRGDMQKRLRSDRKRQRDRDDSDDEDARRSPARSPVESERYAFCSVANAVSSSNAF